MKKIDVKTEKQIIKLYKTGISAGEISKIIPVNEGTVLRSLKRNNISIRTMSDYRKINKKIGRQIISMYVNGIPATKIAIKFNINNVNILKYLRENNIKIKSTSESHTKYHCDDNFFKNIDSESKAYFLGLMVSDGYNNGRGLFLKLQDRDNEILYKFKRHIKYTGEIKFQPRQNKRCRNTYYLHITSYKISEDLTRLGCIKNKSHFTYFPNIPKNLYNHFIRGVFDGDGCIHIGRQTSFDIIGNKKLIKRIQQILMKECNLNKTKLQYGNKHKKNIVRLSYSGPIQCIRIKNYLYKKSTIFLSRKRKTFNAIKTQKKVEGENHGSSKLKAYQVRRIFTSNLSRKELAKKYNVGVSCIGNIKKKERWISVTSKL